MDVQKSSGSGGESDRGEMDGLLTNRVELIDEKSQREANKQKLQVIQDAIRNLDYALLRCDSVESLFGSELLSRRNKVKDLCENTLLESPKALGPVLRDRLWRSVFYDVLGRAKRLKQGKTWNPTQLVYVRNHLQNGIGYMNILLMKLQDLPEFEESAIRLHLPVNGANNLLLSNSVQDPNAQGGKQPQKWMIDLLYAFMLNIGDLHRYLTETFAQVNSDDVIGMMDYDRAQDYYTMAFILNPENGMAHNQLGTLSVKLNGGLDAVYYFLYSMVSQVPYDGACQNLRQLLDKQLVYFATLPAAIDSKTMDVFAHRYMSMVYFFVCEAMHLHNFEKSCQESILAFMQLLYDKKAIYDDSLILRIALVSLMTVWRLQSVDSPAVSAAVAFAIGVFIQLVEKLSVILKENSHLEPEIPMLAMNSVSTVAEVTLTLEEPSIQPKNESLDKATLSEGASNPKSSLPKRRRRNGHIISANFLHHDSSSEDESDIEPNNSTRRRRRAHGKSSEDFSDSELSDSENELWSCSEHSSDKESDDHVSDQEVNGSVGAFGDSSEVSDTSYQAEIERKVAELKLSQGSEENSTLHADGNDSEVPMKSVISKEALAKCWDQVEPILVATMPFMRWFQVAPAVRNAFASNCEKSVLEKFCLVFNLLSSTDWSNELCDEEDGTELKDEFFPRSTYPSFQLKLQENWKALASRKADDKKLFQYELPEDKSLLGLAAFRDTLAELENEPQLSKNNTMVIRIGRFIDFGHWLVGTDEFAVIHLDNSFVVPSVNEYKRHIQMQTHNQYKQPDKTLNKLNKRRSLESKVLGRLLQDAKSEVPERVKNSGHHRPGEGSRRRFSEDEKVWVFVDLSAVLQNLRTIQNLGRHPKFVIVFPHSVYRALDKLKDTDEEGSKVARMASRWLENASYKGSSVRILREHEKSKINITYPAEQTRESWEFFEILESCNYLRNQDMKGLRRPTYDFWGDVRDKYRIFYLTGQSNFITSSEVDRDYDPVGTAKASAVYFDRIQRYEGRLGRGKRNRQKKYSG